MLFLIESFWWGFLLGFLEIGKPRKQIENEKIFGKRETETVPRKVFGGWEFLGFLAGFCCNIA